MNNEKVVQDAIQNALTAYYAQIQKNFTIHGPSNRSQGPGIKQYCGDLIGVLDNAKVILLEVKFKNAAGTLKSFDADQHAELLEYEAIGVPVAYAYNFVPSNEISCFKEPQPKDWPVSTLKQIIRCTPFPLPNAKPAHGHETLWDWLNTSTDDTKAIDMFGSVLGAWKAAPNLRNGKLVLIYAAQTGVMSLLTPEEMKEVSDFLWSNKFCAEKQKKVLQIIRASEMMIAKISQLHPSPTKISSKPSDSKPKH